MAIRIVLLGINTIITAVTVIQSICFLLDQPCAKETNGTEIGATEEWPFEL